MLELLKNVKEGKAFLKIDEFDKIQEFIQSLNSTYPTEMRVISQKFNLANGIKAVSEEVKNLDRDKEFYFKSNKLLTDFFLKDGLIDELIALEEK